jgi:hypothetical protein
MLFWLIFGATTLEFALENGLLRARMPIEREEDSKKHQHIAHIRGSPKNPLPGDNSGVPLPLVDVLLNHLGPQLTLDPLALRGNSAHPTSVDHRVWYPR